MTKQERERLKRGIEQILEAIHRFGYPKVTAQDLAKSQFYQGMAHNLLGKDLHPTFIKKSIWYLQTFPKEFEVVK